MGRIIFIGWFFILGCINSTWAFDFPSFVEISYINKMNKKVKVDSLEDIPRCEVGKIRYKIIFPPPWTAMLILNHCICYSKCTEEQKIKDMSIFERSKMIGLPDK